MDEREQNPPFTNNFIYLIGHMRLHVALFTDDML